MGVEGVNSLMRKFNRLGSIEPVVYQAVKKQAEMVRGVAVKLCPVYDGPWRFVPRGELRRSIYTKVERDADAIIGSVYTDAAHAIFVEFGTGPVGQANHAGSSPNVTVAHVPEKWVWGDDEGGFHTTEGQPAQPFMYPALKSMEKYVVNGIGQDLQAEIRKAGKT